MPVIVKRSPLTVLEYSQQLNDHKNIYESLHPETRQGGTPGQSGGGKTAKTDKVATFAEDIAKKLGKAARR